MKSLVLVFLTFLLVGCPLSERLYFHNESEQSITISSTIRGFDFYNPAEPIVIRSGSAKHVQFYGESLCFEITLNNVVMYFDLDRSLLEDGWKNTNYGARYDVYYEYGRFYLRTKSGEWPEITTTEICNRAYY